MSEQTTIKNYMTPQGYARLKAELLQLLDVERPEVVSIVSWAAKNGDRSENGDYLYGKKRLREIDRRTRFLSKALGSAVVVDPAAQNHNDQVFFGATVTYWREAEQVEETISIVGRDEIDTDRNYVSWMSPIARALLKKREGDEVRLQTPKGVEIIEIVKVVYKELN
ncbi:MAG: greB [Burkholderiaceae bacterium]|nr:greB [Burkholderiaceae bacterium]